MRALFHIRKIHRHLGMALCAVLLLLLWSAAASASAITGIRLGTHEGATRIIIDMDTIASPKIGRMDQPPRLAIDFQGMQWQVNQSPDMPADGLVTGLRQGQPSEGQTRLMLDLKEKGLVKQSYIIPPDTNTPHYRLVVDVVPELAPPGLPVMAEAKEKKSPEKQVTSDNEKAASQKPEDAKDKDEKKAEMPASPPKSMQKNKAHQLPTTKPDLTKTERFRDVNRTKSMEQATEKAAKTLPKSMQKSYNAFGVPIFDPAQLPGYQSRSVKSGGVKAGGAGADGKSMPKSMQKKAAATAAAQPQSQREPLIVGQPLTRKPIIVIDPGHGGRDPGAIGRVARTLEKNVTLDTSRKLKKLLEETGRYTVVMTRNDDRYVDLKERVRMARAAGADLFISVHADSHARASTKGLSVYTISESRVKREGDKLHRSAGKQRIIRDVELRDQSDDVQRVLIDMVQRDTKNSSGRFAEIMVNELGAEATLLRNTHRFAGLAVLTGVDVPSVLVELGYLSNATEEKLLRTEQYRMRLARGMADAVMKYFRLYHQYN